MFTGIVSGLGRVASMERTARGGARLKVAPPAPFQRFSPGESVSVSGVCLTALEPGRLLLADLSSETLRCSTLGTLSAGDPVNLERALAWGDRLSGHFVMGHVDGVALLTGIARAGNSLRFRFSVPTRLMAFVAAKGSVALDGVSLTVAARRKAGFDVAVIPETLRRTTLGRVGPGARLNFEADVFARYGARGWRRAVRPPDRRR
jgi:riboflavin synthase